jgi:hypothetical protein
MDLIYAIHGACEEARIKLVIGLVCVRTPEAATVEEFKAIVSRDLHLDESLVLVLSTPPTPEQVQHPLRLTLVSSFTPNAMWRIGQCGVPLPDITCC